MTIQEIAQSLCDDFGYEVSELDDMSDLSMKNLHADLTQAVLLGN